MLAKRPRPSGLAGRAAFWVAGGAAWTSMLAMTVAALPASAAQSQDNQQILDRLNHLDQRVGTLENAVKDRDAKIQTLENAVHERDATIESLKRSAVQPPQQGAAQFPAPAAGGAQPPSDETQRIENLERTVRQLNGIVDAQAAEQQKTQEETQKKLEAGWWNKTSISGRSYYDLSYINNSASGSRQSNSGTGFDIKRFYVSIDHKFNDIFSADITTDFTLDTGPAAATQLFIKKAYLEANLDPALDIKLGSADLPWVPFLEDVYGYRYIENVPIDRTKFGTSADWGVHAKGKFADGLLNYAVSVVNGAGFKNPDIGAHTNTMDFEGRVDLDWRDFVLAVGGYVGKLGKDKTGTTTFHTASRFDALAAYVSGPVRVGVDYFEATDFNNVTTIASDQAVGVSPFASYQFAPKWGVFGRYDFVQPNKNTNPDLKDNYFNVGVAYSPTKIVDFALVYKRDRAGDGSLSTSNGTIGGLTRTTSGTYDEVGIFGQFRW